ncbi:dual oxidase 2-like [Clavelina lepadiformis]|uniref:dual oxidase 2-like n=1 Tax=Clavelina lepadiformis TaxID=159417 RepID=UPI004041A4AF
MLKFIFVFILNLSFVQNENGGKEYPPYDGWFNNRDNPSSGVIDSTLCRRLPTHYEDGVSAPSGAKRPNPRLVSNVIMAGESGKASYNNKTALFAFFSQHVLSEIVNVQSNQCPPEPFNIPLLENDSLNPQKKKFFLMPYERSRYDTSNYGSSPNHPRNQLNDVTSFLDGGSIYGSQKSWANQLRLFNSTCPMRTRTSNLFASQKNPTDCRGELKSLNDEGRFPGQNDVGLFYENHFDPRDHKIKKTESFYLLGNKQGEENPFLLSLEIMWFRHHNWLAMKLRDDVAHSDWTDEQVFNEARIRNIAVHQKIVMHEWLPILLGHNCNTSKPVDCDVITPYKGYNPGSPVGVTNVFQSAAMRYIDTLTPPGVFVRGNYDSSTNDCVFYNMTRETAGDDENFEQQHIGKPALRLLNTFWNSHEAINEFDIDKLLMGMSSQIAEKEDNVITPDIREGYYGSRRFSRVDAVAMTIQQGRDHGLPDYNTARRELGMAEKRNFEEINPQIFQEDQDEGGKLLENLKSVHRGSIQLLDIFTGGLLETRNGNPGELFRFLIKEQFEKIRDGDRFWFENDKNGLFTTNEIEEIHNVSIRDVILRTNPSMNPSEDLQENPFLWDMTDGKAPACGQPFQLKDSDMEGCTELETYDYFENDQVSFAVVFTGLGVFVFVAIASMYLVGESTKMLRERKRNRATPADEENVARKAMEILGRNNKCKEVQIQKTADNSIVLKSGKNRRLLEFKGHVEIYVSKDKGRRSMFVRTSRATYDLVLKFETSRECEDFIEVLRNSFHASGVSFSTLALSEKELFREAKMKDARDEELKNFFRTALGKSMNLDLDENRNVPDPSRSHELITTRLSQDEFAEYLNLKANSGFVRQMFQIAGSDENDFITIREFLNIIVLFEKGNTPEGKLKLMFDMYDLDKTGRLSADDFKNMLKSMLEAINTKIDLDNLDQHVNEIMTSSGCFSRTGLTFDDFKSLVEDHETHLCACKLNIPDESTKTKRKTKLERFRESFKGVEDIGFSSKNNLDDRISSVRIQQHPGKLKKMKVVVEKYVEHYRLCIFWVGLYTWVTIGVFLYAFNAASSNKQSGLGFITGYAVPLARGAAGALMFNFSTILLTMCRNTITFLRETFVHRYVPFDYAVTMHKIIAWMGMFFSVVHVVAHGINFYSIVTQSPSDLLCYFRDYWYSSDFTPSFLFWCLQTITGVAGVALSMTLIIMYVYACDYARRFIYNVFHWTHFFGYILVYFFTFMHGSAMMVQMPSFYLYFLGPGILYTLDKLYSLSRRHQAVPVVNARHLPSEVLHLEFIRPPHFHYKAGQWVRIASLDQSHNEYHPFTLTSAPCEANLKLHIRAVGPWTRNLRSSYAPENLDGKPYPKLYLEGPFGEGHQDWDKYDVSVLIGGGIGVTPFASILKELSDPHHKHGISCKKVYFIWVARDQRQFEWLSEIIEKAEQTSGMLSAHVFITQIPHKFDLRTTMLYICEKHFHKVAGRSMFTGLKAQTHFGRPNFEEFFEFLAIEHSVEKSRLKRSQSFGVFSCGPPGMTKSIEESCVKLNSRKGPLFCHHFENF